QSSTLFVGPHAPLITIGRGRPLPRSHSPTTRKHSRAASREGSQSGNIHQLCVAGFTHGVASFWPCATTIKAHRYAVSKGLIHAQPLARDHLKFEIREQGWRYRPIRREDDEFTLCTVAPS